MALGHYHNDRIENAKRVGLAEMVFRDVIRNALSNTAPNSNATTTLSRIKPRAPAFYLAGSMYIALSVLVLFLSGCRQVEEIFSERSRDSALPAFVPSQLPSFSCSASSAPSKPVDPKAKAWFDEANAMLTTSDRANLDRKRFERLTKKAADRDYWPAVKATINALEVREKYALIKTAMAQGEPEAFFMMGELYDTGEGVEGNEAKAHAFWYRAALMGEVRAMVKLGAFLSTKQNNSIGWDMTNMPVATSMLECAMRKGHGDAAVPLHEIIQDDITFCPACKGEFAIKPDSAGAKHRGKPYAYDGDITECGARLISSVS